MEQNRPRGRDRTVTGTAKDIKLHGEGLGTGPVGSGSGHAGRGGNSAGLNGGAGRGGNSAGLGGGSTGRGGNSAGFGGGSAGPRRPLGGSYGGGRRPSGGSNPLILVIAVLIVLIGGGAGIGSFFGGSPVTSNTSSTYGAGHSVNHGGSGGGEGALAEGTIAGGSSGNAGGSNLSSGNENSEHTSAQIGAGDVQSYNNAMFGGDPSTHSTASPLTEITQESGGEPYTGENADGASSFNSALFGARAKRTRIMGGGRDSVTIMVYMCGTDLESRSGMATSDLEEMANANLGNINLIVYTGGCTRWKNGVVNSSVNQIYQIRNGRMYCLVENAGTGAMTDPSTLASFIKWCGINYPANRNELIFWDHGGGSVSGYGYDEKNRRSGSMTLSGINKALHAGGVSFDFIGFDACLMATAENALMLDDYGDYLIASEETEPGVGWYYTDWLTAFGANTSLPATEIGRQIADDFVKVCARRCPAQQTTLSVIDLAEFAYTVPDKLAEFAKSISGMIKGSNYSQISSARNRTREFASSTRIDQIDLIDLCDNLGNSEASALAKVLRSSIKYNTCNNITRASGVSIYFPYQSTSKVDSAVNTYSEIGMDTSYAQCIKEFASLESAGQFASGTSGSLLGSLLGGSYLESSATYETDALAGLLEAFFGGSAGSSAGQGSSAAAFFGGRNLSSEEMASYISRNHFDARELVWKKEWDGSYRMTLSENNWKLVEGLDLNLFFDNGKGFIDFGLDNVYSFDSRGRLVANTDKVWLSINNMAVPYYHENTEEDGEHYIISGRIPCLLNGVRSELIVVFDNVYPNGYIAGARTVYKDGETETAAKNLTGIENGDTIQIIADFYGYDGSYSDTYLLGDPIVVTDDLKVGNADFSGQGQIQVTYRFRDIYNQVYWTPVINVE